MQFLRREYILKELKIDPVKKKLSPFKKILFNHISRNIFFFTLNPQSSVTWQSQE
jgi:hypothetical protein